MIRNRFILMLFVLLNCYAVVGQEEDPYISIEIPSQNLLKFNRFLLNPTFSTVNEDKSYINFYHRNQWIQYDNTNQTYLASYSGRIGDRTGLGLSLYHQKFGTISNFGVMANYAYGLKLAEKSNFTFGFNLSYYNSGYDSSEAIPGDIADPRLAELEGNSLLSFQPGFNFSIGSFDIGLYAENLFDYNIKTSKSLTDFNEKTFTGHLMYTKRFEDGQGIMKDSKLTAMTRGRKRGEDNFDLSGSLILDLPKIGWIQGGYDDFYGVAAGIGFNLTPRLSLGYTYEKGIKDEISNFGPTHEFSFAYSFSPTLTEDRVMEDELDQDQLASLDETDAPKSKNELIAEKDKEIAELRKKLIENDLIVEEMLVVQDSINAAREKDIERRFAYLMKFIKDNRDQGNDANYEEKVAKLAKELEKDLDMDGIAEKYAVNTSATKTDQNTTLTQAKTSKTADQKAANEPKNTVKNAVKNADAVAANAEGAATKKEPKADAMPVKKSENNVKNAVKNTDAVAANAEGTATKKEPKTDAKEGLANAAEKKEAIVAKNENTASGVLTKTNVLANTVAKTNDAEAKTKVDEEFENAARMSNVRTQTAKNMQGVQGGYYIIANVYPETKTGNFYMDKFMETLDNKGVKSSNFKNPNNNLKYVYLKRFDTWQEALAAIKSDVDGTYADDKWIFSVQNEDALLFGERDTRLANQSTEKDVKTKASGKTGAGGTAAAGYHEEMSRLYGKTRKAPRVSAATINSLNDGYYIIANVFSRPDYADKFIKSLKDKGIEAAYFVNPKNNYRYVYLTKSDTWKNALNSYYSNINNTYYDDIWIMPVNKKQIL